METRGWRAVARLQTYRVALYTFIALGIICLSDEVVQLVAGPAYLGAAPIVRIVAAGYLVQGTYWIFYEALIYEKATSAIYPVTIVAAASNIILNLLTVPHYGIMAAACNTVVGFVVQCVGMAFAMHRTSTGRYEYRRILVLFVAAGITFAVSRTVNVGDFLVDALAKGLLVVVLFPALLLPLGFYTSQERRKGLQIAHRIMRLLTGNKRLP